MGTRTITALAFAGLMTSSIAFAVQSMPTSTADICALPATFADPGRVELASMFTNNDAGSHDRNLFRDAPAFIYAMNEVARESDGVKLVDVRGVASCSAHKNII